MEKILKILLVDSDMVMRSITELILKRSLFAEVISTGSSEKALQIFNQSNDFDVIVTSLLLGKSHTQEPLDGFGLMKAIRAFNQLLPVIAFTASATPDIEEKCLEAGFTAFVSKFKVDKLPEIILDSLPRVGG